MPMSPVRMSKKLASARLSIWMLMSAPPKTLT